MIHIIGAELWGGSFPTDKLRLPCRPTHFYVDTHKMPDKEQCNIYLQVEPNAIVNNRDHILMHAPKYKYILTFDKSLLHLPNAKKYIANATWITKEDAESIHLEQKKFQLSSLTGAKASTAGHRFRIEVLKKSSDFTIPSIFFRSNIPPMTSKCSDKIHLFREFQFSLVIENSRQDNYFSEKLCDCLYTKTIPIYYGAPNITEYFDTSGWIILENESVDELLTKISILDNTWYQRHLDTVLQNYTTVLQYLTIEGNFNRVLDTLDY